LVRALGPGVLLGSSLGAALAGRAAARNGALGLILVDGPGALIGGMPSGLNALAEPGAGEGLFEFLKAAGPEAAFDTLEPYYAGLRALPRTEQDFLRARVWARVNNPAHEAAFLAVLRDLVSGRFSPDPAGPYTGPTLSVWGERDGLIPPPGQNAVPQGRLAVVPGAGHLPFQDQPQGFLDAVLPFLETL
ncbi:MAG TPA: alpha/beta hydrolase, partial [Deinococcales bacterium]|nr:alpha/beta hydrolase [Deinococcales bacterium]